MEEDYQQKLTRYKLEDKEIEIKYIGARIKLQQHMDSSPLINNLFFQGKISEEEYIKWVLCEDLNFTPKMIK